MTTFTRHTTSAVFAALTLVTISVASAAPAQKLLLNPGPFPSPGCYDLPKFGFSSFNINGFGERVTSVRWGGIAHQLGIESGDVILSLNGFSLSYPGSWNDALREAMYHGGWVQLTIRDVRTGIIATRDTFVGGYGPVVAYSNVPTYPTPVSHTYKTMPHNYPHNSNGVEQIKKLVNLFDKKNNP